MGQDDIAYLEEKGALAIPDKPLRDILITAHIEFIYPYLPSIDLDEFLKALDGKGRTSSRVSLILFQAIMFAGSAFVNMPHLSSAGFLIRKSAQKELLQKVRLMVNYDQCWPLLYKMDCEQDRITLIQALILTFYYEIPDGQKDTAYWVGIVVSE
ncbi:hypothetical protein CEP53_013964, partial [Fusarium sp. AF-6]